MAVVTEETVEVLMVAVSTVLDCLEVGVVDKVMAVIVEAMVIEVVMELLEG